jgi:hypothetical protein
MTPTLKQTCWQMLTALALHAARAQACLQSPGGFAPVVVAPGQLISYKQIAHVVHALAPSVIARGGEGEGSSCAVPANPPTACVDAADLQFVGATCLRNVDAPVYTL